MKLTVIINDNEVKKKSNIYENQQFRYDIPSQYKAVVILSTSTDKALLILRRYTLTSYIGKRARAITLSGIFCASWLSARSIFLCVALSATIA